MSDSESRYEEIRRRIAARRTQYLSPTPSSLLETTLDQLNVYDQLEEFRMNRPEDWVCYAPTPFSGRGWSGVLVWCHRKGYYGYRQIIIFGIWVCWQDENLQIIADHRQRDYSAAVYNPESFHRLIRKSFELYYNDDGRPPQLSTSADLKVTYSSTDRLAIRQQLRALIQQWQQDLDGDVYNSKNPSSPSS
jgi:hypothetical protein